MIEFRNATVKFRRKNEVFTAVDNVYFTIEKGEIFGIAGASGAGKSTLLRTVNLLQNVSSGKVLIDGEDITSYKGAKLREYRRQTGMIFQHFNLADNLTVAQNIAFVLRAAGKSKSETNEKVREYLSLVGIPEKINDYPSKLSGGQKQRVAIARALAGGAKILLCDEPTSALDPETTVAILNLIRALSQKLQITVVIITHELEVIKSVCGRFAVMNGGKVVEIGGVYETFSEPKNGFTKQLIGSANKRDLPPEVVKNANGRIVKLTFLGEEANAPVVSEASNKYSVQFNILAGRIEYIEGKPLGVLYVAPIGKEKDINDALRYLEKSVRKVEKVEEAL